MDALTNATPAVEEIPSSGPAPTAIPDAKSTQTGVSVRYVFHPDRRWYVLRASYAREQQAEDLLIRQGVYAYVAKRWEYQEVGGRPKRMLRSLISSLVFAYLLPDEAELFVRGAVAGRPSPEPRLAGILSYYYDHFQVAADFRNPPLVVSNAEMRNFILATSSHDENLLMLQEGDFTFRSEQEVEVTAGRFQGVRGRVIRAARQQRVLVRLTGVGLCATAYVPTPFLRAV